MQEGREGGREGGGGRVEGRKEGRKIMVYHRVGSLADYLRFVYYTALLREHCEEQDPQIYMSFDSNLPGHLTTITLEARINDVSNRMYTNRVEINSG